MLYCKVSSVNLSVVNLSFTTTFFNLRLDKGEKTISPASIFLLILVDIFGKTKPFIKLSDVK